MSFMVNVIAFNCRCTAWAQCFTAGARAPSGPTLAPPLPLSMYTVLQTADPTCLQFALRSSLNVRSVFVFFRERDDREEIETAN